MAESNQQNNGRGPYRAGVAVAVVTSFLIMWTTIVRDDGSGMSFFMVPITVVVGGFAARFEAAGMARTMLGVAVVQVLLAVAVATAPVTAQIADGPLKALLFGGVFAALWLLAGALFWVAARR
jgi:hypothetical protein